MSVINRMLRDLDARQQRPASGAPMAAIAPRPRSPLGWVLGVVAIALLGVGAWYWLVSDDASQAFADKAVVTEVGAQPAAISEAPAQQPPAQQPPVQATAVPSSPEPSVVAMNTSAPAEPDLPPQPEVSATTDTTKPATPAAEAYEPAPTVTQSEPAPPPVMKIERRQLTPTELIARYQQQAREAQARGALETAAERYQQILALEPNHTETRQQLAALWYGQGFGSRSIGLLREGLSLSANDSAANVALALTLARIHERLAQPEQAFAVLQRLALSRPTTADVTDALALRAELARELGQYEQAVIDYQQLLTWQPNQARWYLAQAVAYEQLAQWPAARNSYQQAQQQAGLSAQSYEFIATRLQAINQQLGSEEGL